MAKTFCIIAGSKDRPETVERGILEKGLGQGTIAGDVIKTINPRGEVGIPNYTEAWGVRLAGNSKEIPEEALSVTDPAYKGQIKELNWGDKRGYLIICRYLAGYQSIDLQYQDLVLNAKDNIREDSDVFYLTFQNGDNFFDPEMDPYLCQMIRVHYLNGSSKSKSPESQNFSFWEKPDVDAEQEETKMLDNKLNSLKIVGEASTDNSLKKLKNLHFIVQSIIVGEVKDENLYSTLQKLADEKPDDFIILIDNYKADMSSIMEKAKSFELLDLTKDGVIAAGKEKKELIAEGVPGKKESMLDWMFKNYLSEKSFDFMFRLKQITDTLN